MKENKAYIKPHMLSKVTRALQKVEGLTGMSVTNFQGFGRGRGTVFLSHLTKVRLLMNGKLL